MNTDERFELQQDIQHGQFQIRDHKESEEKNAIVIYNDLGNIYFSSAPALCELLNELDSEMNELKKFNNCLIHILKLNNIKLDKYFDLNEKKKKLNPDGLGQNITRR